MAGPEWPPSPWRLLRGLAAAWFDANPHPCSETERDDLLQALGRASPPALWLPPVSFAEIPYYQPILTSSPQDRVLHFDHFAVLSEGDGDACFCFDFDVVLSARQLSVLTLLLARITYLGRAESRARLSLVDGPSEHLSKVTPADGRSSSGDIRRRVLVTRSTFPRHRPLGRRIRRGSSRAGDDRGGAKAASEHGLDRLRVTTGARSSPACPSPRRQASEAATRHGGAVRLVPSHSDPPTGACTNGASSPRSGYHELRSPDWRTIAPAHWPRGGRQHRDGTSACVLAAGA